MFFDDDTLDELGDQDTTKAPPSSDGAASSGKGQMPGMPPVPSSVAIGKVEGNFVDLTSTDRGLRHHILLQGPENGPKLVYVPGTLQDFRKSFDKSSLSSMAKTFRILAVDLRNCGETRPFSWASGGQGYSHIASYADDVVAVASTVFGAGVKFDIVGHSSGAGVALWAAHRYPDLITHVVSLAGGFFPNRMEELADDDLTDDMHIFTDEDIGWFTAMVDIKLPMKERCAQLLAYNDTRYNREWQKQNAEMCSAMFEQMAEDENVTLKDPDCSSLIRGARLVECANFICGSPPAHGLEELGKRAMIVGGKFDNMHQAHRQEELLAKMPGARMHWYPEGHATIGRATKDMIEFFGV